MTALRSANEADTEVQAKLPNEPSEPRIPPKLIQNLSPSSRRALKVAENVRRQLSESRALELNTELLLIGLNEKRGGVTQATLATFEVEIGGLLAQLAERQEQARHGPVDLAPAPIGDKAFLSLPYSANVVNVLRLASQLARDRKAPLTRSRHLLMALLANEEGKASVWLKTFMPVPEVRDILMRLPENGTITQETFKSLLVPAAATPLELAALPLSGRTYEVLTLAEQIRRTIDQPAISPRLLLASLYVNQQDSPAFAFLSSFGLDQDELLSDLSDHPLDFSALSEEARSLGADIAAWPQAEQTRLALARAKELMERQGASQIEPRHIFAGLLAFRSEAANWVEEMLGTERTHWLKETLRDWKQSVEFTCEAVQAAAYEAGLYLPPQAYHDSVAQEDLLGFQPYVEALVKIILRRDTVPPLVIGVYGPWGSGKSTFLKLVKDQLDAKATVSAKRVRTSWLSFFKGGPGTPLEKFGAEAELPRLITVPYDAWAYADAARLWTGLIATIAAELDKEIGWWGRIVYLVKRRSRQLLAALALGLVPVFMALLTLVPGTLGRLIDRHDVLNAILAGVIGLIYTYVLQKQPVSRAVQLLTDNFNSAPVSGVIHSIQSEFETALTTKINPADDTGEESSRAKFGQLVRQQQLKIVIFIDELDRCPLERIVDILEAIKLFLSENIFIVLIAIDTRVAAEAIRLHYKEVRNPDLPREYLEKIVQIPLQVPSANRLEIERYLQRLMTVVTESGKPEAVLGPGSQRMTRPQTDGAQSSPQFARVITGQPPGHPRLATPEDQGPPSRPLAPSEKSSLPQLPDTPTEFEIIAELAERFLESNPRRIKRLLNTYRYVKILAARVREADGANQPVRTERWQSMMLAWLAFTMKWPSFMAQAIKEAHKLDPAQDPHDGFLLRLMEQSQDQYAKPSEQQLKTYLNLSARQVKILSALASNFLIETPDPIPQAKAAKRTTSSPASGTGQPVGNAAIPTAEPSEQGQRSTERLKPLSPV